jgi:hypothetical protein
MTGGGGLDKSAASALPAALTKETAAALDSQNLFIVTTPLYCRTRRKSHSYARNMR